MWVRVLPVVWHSSYADVDDVPVPCSSLRWRDAIVVIVRQRQQQLQQRQRHDDDGDDDDGDCCVSLLVITVVLAVVVIAYAQWGVVDDVAIGVDVLAVVVGGDDCYWRHYAFVAVANLPSRNHWMNLNVACPMRRLCVRQRDPVVCDF